MGYQAKASGIYPRIDDKTFELTLIEEERESENLPNKTQAK
jgi:hypothetical protein